MVLFGSFAILGLVLAGVGIYGVIAFGVEQRTQEFGVRMALGARRAQIIRIVLKEGTILAFVGATIGLFGAYLVGRAMQSTLHGVVAEIASDVGYESEASFNRAFKREFGSPPARYRREHRAAANHTRVIT